MRPSPTFDSKIRVALLIVSLLIIHLSKCDLYDYDLFVYIPILDFYQFHITHQAVTNLYIYVDLAMSFIIYHYIFVIGTKNTYIHTIYTIFSVNFSKGESYFIGLWWILRNLLLTALVILTIYLPIRCIINSLNLICSSRLISIVITDICTN